MVKFSHIADAHLGGWRQGPMQNLNFESFRKAIDLSIENKVEFVLIAGDLFDSAYPPIEILKDTFSEFKKLKDAKIPVFLIPGSHDYSASGKSFLDVIERAGFCTNVANFEIRDEEILLTPTIHEGVAFYGYPGKKSGLEVADIQKIKLSEAPGMFKILMLHTTLDKVRGVLPIECVKFDELPEANYYALGHIHVDFRYRNLVYPGPIFPNNFSEIETLENGSFYIIDTEMGDPFQKIDLKIKEIIALEFEINDSKNAVDKIIENLKNKNLHDKLILIRISGDLKGERISEAEFLRIEKYAIEKGAYFVLKNTHDLKSTDTNIEFEVKNKDNLEEEVINKYKKENDSKFNSLIPDLMKILSTEKQEGETTDTFNNRLLEESKKILNLE